MPGMKPTPDSTSQEENTFTFKRSTFYAMLVPLAFAAGLLVGYLAWGRTGGTAKAAVAPSADIADSVPAPTQTVTRYEIPTEGFPSIGPEDAPIVIVEFSDYQCPFCKRWHDEVYQQLMKAYPGQIRLVYRNLPLTGMHPEAQPAAQAALCAGEQNSYWKFHEALFGENELSHEMYVQYATELGLDVDAFQKCISEDRYADFIEKDMEFSIGLGIRSTPTFFVNGLAVVGAQPYEVFKNVIDQELSGKIP